MVMNEVVPAIAELAEEFMNSAPVCFTCKAAPGIMPLVYTADPTGAGRVEGFVFATCLLCYCQDNFETQVAAAIREDQRRREGALWN